MLAAHRDRLLNMRLTDEVDQDAFAAKDTQLRNRLASIIRPRSMAAMIGFFEKAE